MSKTEVNYVDKSGFVRFYGDARNSWGSAPHIWTVLDKKYRRFTAPRETARGNGTEMPILMDAPALKRLWDSLPEMEKRDRWVLGYTFDYAMVEKGKYKTNLEKLIDHLYEFSIEHPSPSQTLLVVTGIMRRALVDPEVQAVCWNQTTVVDDLWFVTSDSGDDDAEREAYNIFSNTGHWFISDESLNE